MAGAEITRVPAALEAVAAWVAVVIAVEAIAAAEVEEDSVVAVAAAAAAAAAAVAVVAAVEDAGDKRTIDGENNYEINNQRYDFVESFRYRGSDRHRKFLRVAIDRGAG